MSVAKFEYIFDKIIDNIQLVRSTYAIFNFDTFRKILSLKLKRY